MNDLQPILIPVDRVADMIGKCRRSIYNLIADGHLDAVKAGRNTLVRYDSVRRYADNLPPVRFKAPSNG
jgi:excisionase family DNA binding protein